MAGRGSRPGERRGGRKPGTPNKAHAHEAEFRRRVLLDARAAGVTPLEFMLALMRDEENPKGMRFEAAKAAAPYIHARLSSVQVSGDADKPIEHNVTVADAFTSRIARLAARAAESEGDSEPDA
jgi:hypothetical protein